MGNIKYVRKTEQMDKNELKVITKDIARYPKSEIR